MSTSQFSPCAMWFLGVESRSSGGQCPYRYLSTKSSDSISSRVRMLEQQIELTEMFRSEFSSELLNLSCFNTKSPIYLLRGLTDNCQLL